MLLALSLFLQLSHSCEHTVADETMASVARTESGFETWALHDNDTGQSFKPSSLVEAATLASSLIGAGHNIDVGLMQVNSANFQRLGLTVVKALDPCASLAAGARVLTDAYQGGASDDEQQHALRDALSRYNTGNASRGYANGYVGRVEAAAARVVPAIRVLGDAAPSQAEPVQPSLPAPSAPAAPAPVVDMLHGTEAPPEGQDGLVNMLGGAVLASDAPSAPVETAAR